MSGTPPFERVIERAHKTNIYLDKVFPTVGINYRLKVLGWKMYYTLAEVENGFDGRIMISDEVIGHNHKEAYATIRRLFRKGTR